MAVEGIKAGIDWLTITLTPDAERSDLWYSRAVHHVNMVSKEGHRLKEYSLQGYSGWGAGGCFVGDRPGGYMAQFAGAYADDAFYALDREDAHISRIDLRVDVQYTEMPQDVAKKGYRSAIRANNELPANRRRKVYIIVGSDGGSTLYVGAPTSEQRGRLYNKEIQSEDVLFSRTWRYECVFRNDAAQRIAAAIRGRRNANMDTIRAIVADWYAVRGVSTQHFRGGAIASVPLARTIPSDVERRLNWLKTQVAPALKYLQEFGATDEMLEALGLTLKRED